MRDAAEAVLDLVDRVAIVTAGDGPAGEERAHGWRRRIRRRGRVREAAEAVLDLVERVAIVTAGDETDGEVDALREALRVGDAPGDPALDGKVLEVLAAALYEKRGVAIVHRHLRDARALRPKPESETAAGARRAPRPVADDVVACLAAQQSGET